MVEELLRRHKRLLLLGSFALLCSVLLSLNLGPANVGLAEALQDEGARFIVFELRMPRILLAIGIGASLAACGSVMQALFRNPLAEPYVLGVSAGAAVGASLAILFGISQVLPLLAFSFAVLTTVLVYTIARLVGLTAEGLILAGVAISCLCSSIVAFLQLLAGEKLHQIVFWLLGSLSVAGGEEASLMLILAGSCGALFLTNARELNALRCGDEEAMSLGVNPKVARALFLLLTSLLTAVSVSFAGIVGFVGLLTPHISRLLVGADQQRSLPLAMLLGALLLLWSDNAARTILQPAELPINVVTSLFGVPFFLYLLLGRAKG